MKRKRGGKCNENKYLKPHKYIPTCNQTPLTTTFKMNFSGRKTNSKGRKPQMGIKKITDQHQSSKLFFLTLWKNSRES